MPHKKLTKQELEDLAWNLILELETCPQGHIISPEDVVECMVKFARQIDC